MKFDISMLGAFGSAVSHRHEPEGIRVLSNVYWRALIVTAFLVTACVLLYSIWGLMRVLNNLGATSGASAPPPSALDRAALDATVAGFEKRQEQFDLLKKNRGTAIPDPSR
ncbi:MAG: hypothetical protein AAB804_01930 [Patescibacteria group bacterium]